MRQDGYLPIAGYGIIGDSRSAVLVAADGGLDWACLPRFDSPSVFGRLLDARRGGDFTIRPTGPFQTERRYAGPTNVLQTTFHTPDGAVRVTDLMPAHRETDKRRRLFPYREIIRRLEGLAGRVEVEAAYHPRPAYGAQGCRLRRLGPRLVVGEAGPAVLHLTTEFPLAVRGERAEGRAVLQAGDRYDFRLTFAEGEPAVVPPLGPAVDGEIRETLAFWRRWAGMCRYRGPYRDAVLRSALVLKLLTYAPSGAVVAAPTTSLPEWPGGVRNWDYRYCWLRDAAFTVRALFALGYLAEGEAFVQWLLHATRLTHPRLQVVYSVHGEASLPEATLDHLEGYRRSRPVRVGNAASRQIQMDLYGEVLDAIHLYSRLGGKLDGDTLDLVAGMARYVSRHWDLPDDGIWEVRSGRAQHVHSHALCWVALDRAAAVLEDRGRGGAAALRSTAEAVRRTVFQRGFNPGLGSFTARLDGRTVDAALLVLP
ncbi:MAG TPA: glycoside hydrolase family 15 protein, partial [Dehalococcoidia bacterium]